MKHVYSLKLQFDFYNENSGHALDMRSTLSIDNFETVVVKKFKNTF